MPEAPAPAWRVTAVGTSIPGYLIAAVVFAIGTPAYLMVVATAGDPSQLLWLVFSAIFVVYALFFVVVMSYLIVTADPDGLAFRSPLLRMTIGAASGEGLAQLRMRGRRLGLPGFRNPLLFMLIWTNAGALDDALQRLKQGLPEGTVRAPPTLSPTSVKFILRRQRTAGRYGPPILFAAFLVVILALSDSLGPAGTAQYLGGLLAGTVLFYAMRRIWIQKMRPRWSY